MKTMCFLFSLLFLHFSYWQLNDRTQFQTDAEITYLWVTGYLLTAVISLVTSLRPVPRKLFLSMMVFTASLAALRIPSIDWVAGVLNNPDNPAANESGGLIVLFLWYLVLYAKAHKIDYTKPEKSCKDDGG